MKELDQIELCDKPAAGQGGFTYIDVMMAIGVMTIGVLGLMMTLTTSMVASGQTEYQVLAKQLTTSTMESIFSARDINNTVITNSQGATNMSILINSPSATGSIFPSPTTPSAIWVLPTSSTNSTATPVLSAGPDGIVGTADDNQAVGTGPTPVVLPNFTRTITVTNLSNNVNNTINLVGIVVTISYKVNNLTYSQSMTSYMALYNSQSISGSPTSSPTP
ncbi:MAG TPA: hypothetical protein VI756_22155 [Blastocatellia bacterium]